MPYDFFAFISRMRFIERWSLMRNTYKENLFEHSAQTAIVAHALAVINHEYFGGSADPDRCAVNALYHDASEIITGDMPTPIKYFSSGLRSAYATAEESAEKRLFSMLPEKMNDAFNKTRLITPEEKKIIKAADTLCAYIKCLEEEKCGNTEFTDAKRSIANKLETYDEPYVRFFMENFIPGFGKTLDALGKD